REATDGWAPPRRGRKGRPCEPVHTPRVCAPTAPRGTPCWGAKVHPGSGGALIDVVQTAQYRPAPDGTAHRRGPGQRRQEGQSPMGGLGGLVRTRLGQAAAGPAL